MKRRSVTQKIKSDPTACESFFMLVVESHILHLFMRKYNLDTLDSRPPNDSIFGSEFLKKNESERSTIFNKAVYDIVDEYTHGFEIEQSRKGFRNEDSVQAYAKEFLTLGLLYKEYNDAIHEGDGSRILRCWRYLLLVFKLSNKLVNVNTQYKQLLYFFSFITFSATE